MISEESIYRSVVPWKDTHVATDDFVLVTVARSFIILLHLAHAHPIFKGFGNSTILHFSHPSC